MDIKVFGPGCTKCAEAEKLVKEVAALKGGDIVVQKVSDLREMMAAGILATPAISINGVVKCTGRIPTKEELTTWVDEASSAPTSTASSCCCGKKN